MSVGMMKAWRIHGYGAADVLICDDVLVPEIGPDQVRIRTYAAGINPADWRTRNGHFSAIRPATFPLTLGLDVAGTVELAGPQVRGFRPGDRVIVRAEGAFAEFVVAKAVDVAHAPNAIPLEHAAGIPVAAGTAWLVLFEAAAVRRGQTILILGASGGSVPSQPSSPSAPAPGSLEQLRRGMSILCVPSVPMRSSTIRRANSRAPLRRSTPLSTWSVRQRRIPHGRFCAKEGVLSRSLPLPTSRRRPIATRRPSSAAAHGRLMETFSRRS